MVLNSCLKLEGFCAGDRSEKADAFIEITSRNPVFFPRLIRQLGVEEQ